MTADAQQPQREYLLITPEELMIVEHGCIHPESDSCLGNKCKYHDPNPSFRDNVVCLLNQHDVADIIRSRKHTQSQDEKDNIIKNLKAICKAQNEKLLALTEIRTLRSTTGDEPHP
jgi:hypothetical protein